MFNVPLRSTQITTLFRLVLLINFLVISWFAFKTSHWDSVPDLFSDKVKHFFAFFVLAYCIDRSFPNYRFLRSKLAVLMGYGLAIELIQSQIPGREISGLDFLADCVGIGTYWCFRNGMRRLPQPTVDRTPDK